MHGRSLPRTAPRFEMRMVAQQGQLTTLQQNQFGRRGNELRKKIDEEIYYHNRLTDGDSPQEGILVTYESIKN